MTLFSAMVPFIFDTFELGFDRKLLLFHETVVTLCTYCFLFFKMASDFEINFKLGYAPIAILCLYIGLCLLMVFIISMNVLKKRIRFNRAKNKYLKQREILKTKLMLGHKAVKKRLHR